MSAIASAGLSELERERLEATFVALCSIPSPTGAERRVADWLTRTLSEFGLTVIEDDAGPVTGSDAGNLLVRIPGRAPNRLLLCAHMDTVPPVAALEPVQVDDGFQNAGPGILGADNKAAVAALVEVARRYAFAPPPVGLELLFTVSEETGLHGAKAFDTNVLEARYGYVFDHATPLGGIVSGSPTYVRITAEVHGRAAHAGLHPEQGLNAIVAAARAVAALPQGRIDAVTTANVGRISGGTATNVVADSCRIETEVRSLEQARVDAVVTQSVDILEDAVDGAGADLDIGLETMFTGYRTRRGEASTVLAERALAAIGHRPRAITSGGGSDANAFRAAGLEVTNLANGTERAHERTERVSRTALADGLRLARALVELAEPAE